MKNKARRYAGKDALVALLGVFLFISSSVNAALINYEIVYFQTDFAEIPAYSGGFTYDDVTMFVSDFTLDLDLFGQVHLAFGVPAAALAIDTPPGTAFNAALFASLSGGDAGICANGCNAVFNESNVFAVMDDFSNLLQGPAQSPASNGFYQILPSAIPEPFSLTLMLLGSLVVAGSRCRRSDNRT